MNTHSVSTLVIGAGPAGASAAMRLAMQGAKPLLIDKGTFPRDKSCGDAVSGDGITVLKALGLYDAVAANAYRCSEKHLFVAGDPEPRVVPMDTLTLPRHLFDNQLLQGAIESGAEFLQAEFQGNHHFDGKHHFLDVITSEGKALKIQAKYVIQAFGCQSHTALGEFTSRHGVAAPDQVAIRGYYRADWPIREREYHFLRELSPGYAWVFPLGDGLFNVGCGGKILQARPLKPKKTLAKFISDLDRQYGCSGSWEGPLKGATLRTAFSNLNAFSKLPGMLPVGEVLGSTYTFSGGGIGRAMKTGLFAADAILAAADNEESSVVSTRYYASLRSEMIPSYYHSIRACDYLITRSPIHQFVYRKVFNNRIYPDFVPDVLSGRVNPSRIFSLQHIFRLLFSR